MDSGAIPGGEEERRETTGKRDAPKHSEGRIVFKASLQYLLKYRWSVLHVASMCSFCSSTGQTSHGSIWRVGFGQLISQIPVPSRTGCHVRHRTRDLYVRLIHRNLGLVSLRTEQPPFRELGIIRVETGSLSGANPHADAGIQTTRGRSDREAVAEPRDCARRDEKASCRGRYPTAEPRQGGMRRPPLHSRDATKGETCLIKPRKSNHGRLKCAL